jgi:PAS domain S-box-containing protein
MTVELDGTISTWNPEAEALFGAPAKDVLGRWVELGLASPQDPDAPYDVIARALGGHVVGGDRVRATRPNGSELLVEVHAAIRRDERGEPVGVVAQLIDVTERTRLEASFRQGQRMEAVARLAGVVAHDLNNAMTAARGYADFIATESPDPNAVSDAQHVIRAVDGATRMTNQLLAFAGGSSLQPRIIDVVGFISGMESDIVAMLGANLRVELRHGIQAGSVRVDPARFGDALRSLVVRARDAMPDGGRLTIETSRRAGEDGQQGRIVVSVADTGEAVEFDAAEQLFDPFLTTGLDPRTGLELALAFAVVRQSGGEIEVRREDGGGSTIEVSLPEVEPSPAKGG